MFGHKVLYMSKDTRLHPVEDDEQYVVEKNYILKNPQLPSRLTKIKYEPWMAAEIKKCVEDPIYFAENYFYIVSLDEGRIKIPLYEIQKKILKMMVENNRVAIVSSRQMGKTTMMTIFALYYTIFQSDKTVLLVANKQGTAREVLGRIRLAYENLPVWLKPGVTEWQKESVKFANGSRIAISSTSTSAGRSFSINCLLIDECAFIPPHLSDEFFTSVLPTITSSKKSKLILTSTPNGASGYFYERVRDAMRGKTEWKYVSVPWTSIPGRDLEWYKKALSDCNNDEKFFSQEYACAFLQDGDMAFDKAYLEEMKRRTKEAPVLNTQEYKVWETPKQGHTYAMGVDVAEGVGDCASCVQVIDITDLTNIRQVACYNNRSIDPSHFAKVIFDIALQWGKPYVLIERNNMGIEVVSRLEGEPFYYPKLIAYDAAEREKAKRNGIISSVQSKYDGVSNMRYYMNVMRAMDIPDAQTLTEFDTFIRWPNGTYKKANGDGIFDDRVMALCWALFILHTPIAQKYLNVTEWSETGKPAKLGKPNEEQQFLGIGFFQDDKKKKVVYDPLFGVGVLGESKEDRTVFAIDEMSREDLERAGWKPIR